MFGNIKTYYKFTDYRKQIINITLIIENKHKNIFYDEASRVKHKFLFMKKRNDIKKII